MLALEVGLPTVVAETRKHTDKPLIYDHQKAGTDIPATGEAFMQMLKRVGMDAVILFPMAGPQTQSAWTMGARNAGLGVILGGHMTHPAYLASDGGYITDAAVDTIYERAAEDHITDFVVPGNKPEVIQRIRERLTEVVDNAAFYAPGFITQGGSISEAAKAAGARWHAIVGRALFLSDSGEHPIRDAALGLVANL